MKSCFSRLLHFMAHIDSFSRLRLMAYFFNVFMHVVDKTSKICCQHLNLNQLMLITFVVNILRSILIKLYGRSNACDIKMVTKIICCEHNANMMLVTSLVYWRPSTVKYITNISTFSHISSPTHVTKIAVAKFTERTFIRTFRHLWVKNCWLILVTNITRYEFCHQHKM